MADFKRKHLLKQLIFAPGSPSPTTGSIRYQSNHPWLTIIEPGPWRHLPPAKAPTPAPRSWYRPKVPPPNPFAKDANKDPKPEPADQTECSVAADGSENGGNPGTSGEPVGDTGQMGSSHMDETGNAEGSGAGVTEAAAVVASSESQSQDLPRSLSVPTLTSAQCSPQPADVTCHVTSCQSKVRKRLTVINELPLRSLTHKHSTWLLL